MAEFPKPPSGDPITMGSDGKLVVGNNPIIPFIEGDGTGRDIWRASVRVMDAAVEKAYGGEKKVASYEVYAGEKAFETFENWLPDETTQAFQKFHAARDGAEVRRQGRRQPELGDQADGLSAHVNL
jgi:isocitrate dehydrogenase